MSLLRGTRVEALSLVNDERNRQDTKWGVQSHSPEKWVGILGEEFGEYCAAVNETVFDNGPEERKRGGYENMMRELTHIAAVAVAAMECLMHEREADHKPKDSPKPQETIVPDPPYGVQTC